MKNYIKLLIAASLIAAPVAQAVDLSSVDKIVSKIGAPEEAKNMYEKAKKGFNDASADVKRLSAEVNKLKAECPLSSLNPFNKQTYKPTCVKKTAELAMTEIKLKAAQAEELWNSELMKKVRGLIEKNWPAIKKQLGFK
jgi:hypothetical protein